MFNNRERKTLHTDSMYPDSCPDCGTALEQSCGCTVCRTCGYSPCG